MKKILLVAGLGLCFVLVMVGLLLFTPIFGELSVMNDVVTLTPGESYNLNGYEVVYEEDGSFLPGGCFTPSIGVSSDYMSVDLECGDENYELRFYKEDDLSLHILKETRIFPLISWR